ncbi:MAG: methyltransferase domain-containing protein [Verrucomicrobia bacterium]|nr:methyltransferase domain-containing protein [Verrucomicrobiota bacterium]
MRQRSAQAENFDQLARRQSETLLAFRDLDRLNAVFRHSDPFRVTLPRWLGPARCERLEILDLGAGTARLGQRLTAWAGQRGWRWRFTNLDLNRYALELGAAPRAVSGSALALPFENGSFDLVIASQMTHHLATEALVAHLREAWRVTRDAVLLCDLHRNGGLYVLVWLLGRFLCAHSPTCADALISVRRGFRIGEWHAAARAAGLTEARVWLYWGARIVLQARKHGQTANASSATCPPADGLCSSQSRK